MSAIIGHEAIVRELRSFAASDDPPHALLLAGPEGCGRGLLALEYARLLNCEAAASPGPSLPLPSLPCGVCRPCRLIAEGAHPDVILLGPGDTLCRPRAGEGSHELHPDSRDIRICQVRGLIELAARYPFEARYRMVVIDPADRLGRDASHTILKTLEEPPGHTVFALVTAAPEMIIETVRSRCRRIDVHPVSRSEIEAGLIARGIDAAVAARAAAGCHGLPGRAIAFAADPALMGDRDRLIARCARVAAGLVPARLAHAGELAESWRRERSVVLRALDAWEAFWEERLRAAAVAPGPLDAAGPVAALRAVAQARADLQAQVQARPALELMLLTFPPVTLDADPEEEPTGHA
ncbi:MAG: DNA polymerase III subunit [Thermoflexaceae bacterium]|nr:DNA polymerase III subunit [Thermoflexaceae bacterium]